MVNAATALATRTNGDIIESVIVAGDLSRLEPAQRVAYYKATCESLGLNPLTRPFEYITLNGKLILYARKDATDQLRSIKGISIDKPDITFQDDWIIVTVVARDASGRTDSDIGVVNKKDMRGDFGNAVMKAVTKAKRRVTLSICGLGMLDETEVETIRDARPVLVNEVGEVITTTATPAQVDAMRQTVANVAAATQKTSGQLQEALAHNTEVLRGPQNGDEPEPMTPAQRGQLWALIRGLYPSNEEQMNTFRPWLMAHYGTDSTRDLTRQQTTEIIAYLNKLANGEAV